MLNKYQKNSLILVLLSRRVFVFLCYVFLLYIVLSFSFRETHGVDLLFSFSRCVLFLLYSPSFKDVAWLEDALSANLSNFPYIQLSVRQDSQEKNYRQMCGKLNINGASYSPVTSFKFALACSSLLHVKSDLGTTDTTEKSFTIFFAC